MHRLFLLLWVISCTSTKIATTQKIKESQAVQKQLNLTTKVVTPPIKTEFQIFEPCQEQGEILNTQLGKTQIKVTREGQKLKVNLSTDSVQSVFKTQIDTLYQTEIVKEFKDREVTVYRPPSWAWYSLVVNAVFLGVIVVLLKKAFF